MSLRPTFKEGDLVRAASNPMPYHIVNARSRMWLTVQGLALGEVYTERKRLFRVIERDGKAVQA